MDTTVQVPLKVITEKDGANSCAQTNVERCNVCAIVPNHDRSANVFYRRYEMPKTRVVGWRKSCKLVD